MSKLNRTPWIIQRPKYGVNRLRNRETGEVIGQIQALPYGRYFATSVNGQERVFSNSREVPTDFPGGEWDAARWVFNRMVNTD